MGFYFILLSNLLGVHFVSDVLAGVIVGAIIGAFVYYLYRFSQKRILRDNFSGQPYSTQQIKLITLVLASYILSIILFSELLIYIFETNLFS